MSRIDMPTKQVLCTERFHIGGEGGKVLCFAEHPTKPWIATASDHGVVSIYNYEDRLLVHSFNITDKDDSKRERANLDRYIERMPDYKGPTGRVTEKFKKSPGTVKRLAFFDTDVQRSKILIGRHLHTDSGPADGGISNSVFGGAHTCSWIIIVAEYRIIFFNYVTFQQRDLKLSLLDNKAQQCVQGVGVGPVVAFGGSDGVLRLFDIASWKTTHRLSIANGHKSIEQIHCAINNKGQSVIVTVGSEGNKIKWTSFGDEPIDKHQSDIVSSSLNPLSGDVITATSSKSLQWWKVVSGENTRTLSPNKQHIVRVSSFHHPRVNFNTVLLILRNNDSKLQVYNELDGLYELNSDDNLSGKKCKFQDIHVHTFRPRFIFAHCSRSGLYVLEIDEGFNCPSMVVGNAKKPRILYADPQNQIMGMLMRTKKHRGKPPASMHTLAPQGGPAVLGCSSTGRYFSILWPDVRKYEIWDMGKDKTSQWVKVAGDEEGFTIDLAWASGTAEDQYALLATKVVEETPETKKKRKINSVIGKTNRSSQVMSKLVRFIALMEMADGQAKLVSDLPGCPKAHRLLGGNLLGLCSLPDATSVPARAETQIKRSSTMRVKPPGSMRIKPGRSAILDVLREDDGAKLPTVSFYTWSGTAVDGQLPEPLSLSWDPSQQFCAVTFPDMFCIYSVQPSFQVIYTTPVRIFSTTWLPGIFLFTTDNTVEMVFPQVAHWKSIMLASRDPSVAQELAKAYKTNDWHKHLMPLGPCSLFATDDSVAILNSFGATFQIPLAAPMLQFYVNVAGMRPGAAVMLIESIAPEYHGEVAQFLTSTGYPKAVCDMQSLSFMHRFAVCVEFGLTDTALVLMPEMINEALATNSVEDGKKMVDKILAVTQDAKTKDAFMQLAVRLDTSYFSQLLCAPFSKKRNKALYERLIEAELYDLAVVAAQELGDEAAVLAALEKSSFCSGLLAFSTRGDGYRLDDAMQERLNAELLANQERGSPGMDLGALCA